MRENPLDFVDIDDVIERGDPSKWRYLGPKRGSPTPATSMNAPPGTMKHYDQMLTDQVGDLLHRLRAGQLDGSNAEMLEGLPAADFVQELRRRYPVVFQERSVGRKVELGLAKSLQFQLVLPSNDRQVFASADLFPIFRSCLLLSTYDDYLSGITVATSIRIRPSAAGEEGLVVAIGKGYKLDKMPDGWVIKAQKRRATVLSESFLRARGWRFEVLQPFHRKS